MFVGRLLFITSEARVTCKEIFVEIGSPSVPYLIKLLSRKKIYEVVNALGEIGDERAVEPLIEYLLDKDVAKDVIDKTPLINKINYDIN